MSTNNPPDLDTDLYYPNYDDDATHGDDDAEKAYRVSYLAAAEMVCGFLTDDPQNAWEKWEAAIERADNERHSAKSEAGLSLCNLADLRGAAQGLAHSYLVFTGEGDKREATKAEAAHAREWLRRVKLWAGKNELYVLPPMPSDCEPDPKGIPLELLRVPGFMGDVMEFTLNSARYPSPALAFAGALSLLSLLSGRKVRDISGLRTNLFILAIANSASGKDAPRQTNARILSECRMITTLGESFASSEGLEDGLKNTPAMLFQVDEIDSLIRAMATGKEARFETLLASLKKLATSANSIYPMRRKAGGIAEHIENPHLVLFGTATPAAFYSSLNERLLADGLFARMLVIDPGPRGEAADPLPEAEIPPGIIETASWWRDYIPGNGNLSMLAPTPRRMTYTPQAEKKLKAARKEIDAKYRKAEANQESGSCAILGRTLEQASKLAMLYAISADREANVIDEAAVEWGIALAKFLTMRTLERVRNHVAANPFDELCLRFKRKIAESPELKLDHSTILKKMRIDARTLIEVTRTLQLRGEIRLREESTGGRQATIYVLLNDGKEVGKK